MNKSTQDHKWIELVSSQLDPELICFGKRIANLLESKKTQQHGQALATLDDLLGAAHALILALHNKPPFEDRPEDKKIETKPLLDRAKGIAHQQRIRLTGKWMAGFHFNSAIFRISSVYNRSLKIITDQTNRKGGIGDRKNLDSLISKQKKPIESGQAMSGRTRILQKFTMKSTTSNMTQVGFTRAETLSKMRPSMP